MISESKFNKLRKITKYFRIAEELKVLRDEFLKEERSEFNILRNYYSYLLSSDDPLYLAELKEILEESCSEVRFEKIHFLYHRIMEDFGYPVSENQFIKTSKDSLNKAEPKTKLIIILENLRSAFNVGSIIRSSECFGVNKLILCGITPGTENQKTLKTAKGTHENVETVHSSSIENTIAGLKEQGYRIVGAETGKGSKDLNFYDMAENTAIIFGNEEIGITLKTIDLCDDIVSIKLKGRKNSLNVSNAVSIFLYEYSKKVY